MASLFGSWFSGRPSSPSSDGETKPDGIEKISSGVYKLREPVEPVAVEIVLIHGLQMYDYREAYWKTWMGGKDCRELCWPKEWLAQDFPGARIWSLSYDSTALKTSDTGNVDGYAAAETLVQEMVEFAHIGQHGCPVVFVCHSLGGLMAKEIVILAHHQFGTNPKYAAFLQSIRGFLYYSTPHDGSFLANYVRRVPNMGPMVAKLEVINNGIGRLNSSFQHLESDYYPNRWKHSAVGEAHDTKVPYTRLSMKIVEEASARHGYKFMLAPADHFEVCKPREKTGVSYHRLVNLISEDVGVAKRERVELLC